MLGDGHEQQVEELALRRRGLVAGEQQVEVLREREAAHEVAGEVAPAHLDAVGMRLADVADGLAGHEAATLSGGDGDAEGVAPRNFGESRS